MKSYIKMGKTRKITSMILALFIISVIGLIAFFNYSYKDRILPNIYINGEKYDALTFEEAKNRLENRIKDAIGDGIIFSYQDKTYVAQPVEIGLSIDTEKSAKEAYSYGHDKDILGVLNDEARLAINKVDIWIDIKIDDNIFNEFISKEIAKIENPPKNFTYEYSKGKFEPVASSTGMVLNRTELKNTVINNLSVFKKETIGIALEEKEPEVTKDANETALMHAKNIAENKLILKYNSSKWALQKDDIISFVKFDAAENASGGFNKVLEIAPDKDGIETYLLTLVPQINQAPVNAQLEAKDGKVKVFSLDHDGIALNVEKSAEVIGKTFFVPENYTGPAETTSEIDLAIDYVEPEITIESINNMGITALLSTGKSNFAGSPKNRRLNIAVGSAKFQGILIGPGDEFSFNKALGNVGPKEGYLPELVIKKGATVPEYGGGICQVSTTVFRAAVLAGLEITMRQNHAYAVKYYNPQGMDATIYPPYPDLRFKNNTPAYILIQTRIEGDNLYFDFYGSDDGRKVEAKDPYIYDKKTDGSMKAVWTQTVLDKDGNLILEKKFYSTYKSPALYPHKNPLE